MSRWIAVLALTLGTSLVFQSYTPVLAEEAEAADTEITATSETTSDAAPQKAFPTKASIREVMLKGKTADAEAAYLEWATYWQDDDASLGAPIFRTMLLDQYKAGSHMALVALAQSGDVEALDTLAAQVLSNSENWPPADLIPAIRYIGVCGHKDAIAVLRAVLYNENPTVVNAAIEALGSIGDERVAKELMDMFDTADPARSVALARALVKLGKTKQVQARFIPQLKFTLPGVQEKAALVLAVTGQQKGWPHLQHMLQAKQEPYYPLVLTVLGSLPTDESAAFVSAALAGEEAEQLAALQSINVLPAEKIEPMLLTLMRNEDLPVSIRAEAVRQIAAMKIQGTVTTELRTLATSLGKEDPELKAEAMMALASYGLLNEYNVREVIRQRVQSDELPVARASRAVLLSYMASAK